MDENYQQPEQTQEETKPFWKTPKGIVVIIVIVVILVVAWLLPKEDIQQESQPGPQPEVALTEEEISVLKQRINENTPPAVPLTEEEIAELEKRMTQ